MSNLSNPSHPSWCEHGPECVDQAGLHQSQVVPASRTGTEVIQVGAGLWQMDLGPVTPRGVLLEFSAGEDVERWPIDLAQAGALVSVLQNLLSRVDQTALRAA